MCEAGGSSTTADEDLKLELPQKSAGLTPIKRGSAAQSVMEMVMCSQPLFQKPSRGLLKLRKSDVVCWMQTGAS